MDDDDDFDVFAKIDSIVEQYNQTKVNNRQNGSPQNTNAGQRHTGSAAPNPDWQQPSHGSQPPLGLVDAAPPPSFGQQQGQPWQQPPRPNYPARPEPTKQGVRQQDGYSSAPKNVFGESMPASGAPAQVPPHARQPHAHWQPRPSGQAAPLPISAAAAQPARNQYTGPAVRPPYAAGAGAPRPGMGLLPAARPGSAVGGATPASRGAGGIAPGQQGANSARMQPPAGASAATAPAAGGGQRMHAAGNAMTAAQPRPLNMHSPVRGGGAPAPSPTPPTNSLLAAQLAGPEALPELNTGATLERLQREKDELQRRLNDNEGQNALLRARVERAERERREMQTRAAHSSQAGLAAATSADLQRQLDIARQQLAFKEQEAAEILRRNQDRDERLKAADAQAAALAAEAKRLEQQHAQLEAELAEAHRDRRERAGDVSTSGNDALHSPAAARRSLSPRNWQQQQPSASGRKSAAATAAGSAAGAPRSSVAAGQKRRLSGAAAAAADPRSQIGERSGIARSSQPTSGRAAENAPAEPLHERARWQSAAPPPGDASLWQRLSAACGTSLATLLEERGKQEKAGGVSSSAEPCGQAADVAKQARLLAWGVDSAGPALLCALCSSLAAAAHKGSAQASDSDVRWHCAMLDVQAALMRLCGSCQAAAVASLAPAGQASAAQPAQASGVGARVQLHGPGRPSGAAELATASHISPEVLRLGSMRLMDAAPASESLASHLSHLRNLRQGEPERLGRGVLNLLLSLLLGSKESSAVFKCAMKSLAALVAAAPPADRDAMSPVLTSGVLERLACHQAAFLQLLHLLLECPAICDMLEARLAAQAASGEGDGEAQGPMGGATVAPAADGGDVQAPAAHGKAGEASWSGCWNIFRALNGCLTAPPAAAASTPEPPLTSSHRCPFEVARRALQVVALCMEADRTGLLLALLSEDAGSPSLVLRLVMLVDAATLNVEGGPLRALAAPAQPANASEALRWRQALRLTQEALTLLRGLSVQEHLRELVIEEHLASSASTRLCHTVVGRIVQLPPLPGRLARSAAPLLLAPWAHAVGASSVTRSVCVSGDSAGCLPVATVEDVMHLAKGLLRRVQERLPVLMQP